MRSSVISIARNTTEPTHGCRQIGRQADRQAGRRADRLRIGLFVCLFDVTYNHLVIPFLITFGCLQIPLRSASKTKSCY